MTSESVTGIKVTGINGTVFDLVNGTEGAVLTAGLGGVLLPSFDRQDTRTARAPGRRVGGIKWDPSTLRARVTVADTWLSRPDGRFRKGAAWIDLDRTFKGAFSPLAASLVTVAAPNGPRTLRGRLEALEDVTEGGGPLRDVHGRADYELTLGADHPFWQGAPIVLDFPYADTGAANYYGPTNAAPPFVISRANALARATVLNPGEAPAYPTWEITGPATATVGVGDHVTEVEALATGQRLTILTEPNGMDVTDAEGNRAWSFLRTWDFAALPAGESSTVLAGIVGGGPGASIRMTVTPNYLSWQ
ncbi:hypothetical protein [Rhodococcus koreensis]|uniref:hypothetical protein n=1 Tax=Rhodococcus koreensis TaxID=99653 RepID=UPI0019814137|nr:hypothetical protein [Rhodococcus koreensis]QSE84080.1 hypothetical protein JWS14_35525 [Rhodococcus koreensis]